jgi:hypothetical protein
MSIIELSALNGRVRRGTVPDYSDADEKPPAMNQRGELIVSQGLPALAEITRLGHSWSVAVPTANAFQPVAALPTTLANIVLYNGEASGGKSYVIDTVWASAITSIAAATSFTLLAQISNAGVAAPTNNTAVLITSKSGKSTYAGLGRRAIANSAFAVADKWTMVGQSSGHPSTAIGAGAIAEVSGRFVVPPGATFCVNVIASTAGGTMIQGIDWHEVQIALG